MRGKNTKKRSAVFRASEPSCQPDKEDEEGGQSNESIPSRAPALDTRSDPSVHRNRHAIVPGARTHGGFMLPWIVPAPAKTPHDLALVDFPEVLDPATRQLLHGFFISIKESMYPVEWCFGPDYTQSCWFQWLYVDLAYYYSCLFVASSFKDLYEALANTVGATPDTDLSKKLSGQTLRYLRLTIDLLQKRLEKPGRQLDDATVAIVVSLAMVADIVGDAQAALAHVNGLKQMVRMRGGIKGMTSNRGLLSKIYRVDLGYAIKYGERPEFVADDLSWEPAIDRLIHAESPIVPRAAPSVLQDIIESLDPKIRSVFQDLRAFASVADGLIATKSKLRPELFQEIMMSIQYRLLLLETRLEAQPIDEAIRLGLIAFQTSVFLQMYGTKVKYEFLNGQLASAVQRFPESSPALVQLKTWLAFIASIAVLDSNEPWLVAIIRRLTLGSDWLETRRSLEDVMWVGVIHNGTGKRVYNSVHVYEETVSFGF